MILDFQKHFEVQSNDKYYKNQNIFILQKWNPGLKRQGFRVRLLYRNPGACRKKKGMVWLEALLFGIAVAVGVTPETFAKQI